MASDLSYKCSVPETAKDLPPVRVQDSQMREEDSCSGTILNNHSGVVERLERQRQMRMRSWKANMHDADAVPRWPPASVTWAECGALGTESASGTRSMLEPYLPSDVPSSASTLAEYCLFNCGETTGRDPEDTGKEFATAGARDQYEIMATEQARSCDNVYLLGMGHGMLGQSSRPEDDSDGNGDNDITDLRCNNNTSLLDKCVSGPLGYGTVNVQAPDPYYVLTSPTSLDLRGFGRWEFSTTDMLNCQHGVAEESSSVKASGWSCHSCSTDGESSSEDGSGLNSLLVQTSDVSDRREADADDKSWMSEGNEYEMPQARRAYGYGEPGWRLPPPVSATYSDGYSTDWERLAGYGTDDDYLTGVGSFAEHYTFMSGDETDSKIPPESRRLRQAQHCEDGSFFQMAADGAVTVLLVIMACTGGALAYQSCPQSLQPGVLVGVGAASVLVCVGLLMWIIKREWAAAAAEQERLELYETDDEEAVRPA